MQASSVWPGEYYAYATYIPSKGIPHNAVKVKVVRKFQQQLPGNKRMSTFAQVEFNSGMATAYLIEVNVNRLYAFWDDYVAEREAAERSRNAIAEAERHEIAARQEREQQQLNQVAAAFSYRYNLPRDIFRVGRVVGRDYYNVVIKVNERGEAIT